MAAPSIRAKAGHRQAAPDRLIENSPISRKALQALPDFDNGWNCTVQGNYIQWLAAVYPEAARMGNRSGHCTPEQGSRAGDIDLGYGSANENRQDRNGNPQPVGFRQIADLVLVAVVAVVALTWETIGLAGVKSFDNTRKMRVQLAETGGALPGAEVTYLGVPIGKVTDAELVEGAAELRLTVRPKGCPTSANGSGTRWRATP